MKFACGRIGLVVASLVTAVSLAHAAAPVGVDGWRYVEGPNDLHLYVCGQPGCIEGSRVFWHFEAPNSAPFPGIWRKQEAAASEILGEPGKMFSPSSIELATGRMHRLAMWPDGSKSYYEFADVNGPKWRASLTSVSPDEEASRANLELFEAALKQIRN